MKITRTLLEENQACIPQKEIFIAEFPEGMDLTRENLEKCITLKIPIEWLQCLLPLTRLEIFQEAYATARMPYNATCAPAWATYYAALVTLGAALGATYYAPCATAFETYEAMCETARVTYDATCATAFVAFRSAIIDPLLEAFKEETSE